MADGIEVEQMVESRPKKVNFLTTAVKKLLSGEFLSHIAVDFYACFVACGLCDAHLQRL